MNKQSTKISKFKELNLLTYDDDEVQDLNEWAIAADIYITEITKERDEALALIAELETRGQ